MNASAETNRYLYPCANHGSGTGTLSRKTWPRMSWSGTTGARSRFVRKSAVLESLAPEGLPPFDAVVLLLAACRDSWEQCHGQLLKVAVDHREPLNTLIEQLCIVNALPASLRASLEAKVILAGILFEGRTGRGSAAQATRILEGFDQFDPHVPSPVARDSAVITSCGIT